MEPQPARAYSPTLYESLEALPEGVTGEILDGQLHTQPRPAGPHAMAGSVLGTKLLNPFQIGDGGPGGWWIIDEPEIHFARDIEVTVPDLAGWRRQRMPYIPEGLDPGEKTLEVYRLDDRAWVESGFFSGTDQVVAPPFEAVSIDLGLFWPPRGPVSV